MTAVDVAVAGGGLIGMSIAWRCRQAGLSVDVYDPDFAGRASTTAAGMLAPVTEADFGEEPLLRLALESARRWEGFAAELDAAVPGPATAAGDSVCRYRGDGTLLVGLDDGDRGEIERMHRFYRELGLESELLDARQCRQYEPLLSRRVTAGILAAGDGQADPRRTLEAVRAAATAAGVRQRRERAYSAAAAGAETLVVAAGAWSAQLADLPVRPVRGQVLRLRGPAQLRRTVRAYVGGRRVYAVPRADGEVVVGATSHERGFDAAPAADDAYTLLRDLREVLPELCEYELAEVNVGFRPGVSDNAPLLGRTADPRVVAATGHYRQGVLLAPITADLISELLVTGRAPSRLRPFDPLRFAASNAAGPSAGGGAADPAEAAKTAAEGSAATDADDADSPRGNAPEPTPTSSELCSRTAHAAAHTSPNPSLAEEATVQIRLNGEISEVRVRTVDALVADVAGAVRSVAVAVNGEVVPRADWNRELVDDDQVEILTANPGG